MSRNNRTVITMLQAYSVAIEQTKFLRPIGDIPTEYQILYPAKFFITETILLKFIQSYDSAPILYKNQHSFSVVLLKLYDSYQGTEPLTRSCWRSRFPIKKKKKQGEIFFKSIQNFRNLHL